MKALIIKDLFQIKGNLRMFIFLVILYGFLSLNSTMSISFILPFLSLMVVISTFSYDEYNKWDAYAITLPGGKKNIVKSKYLLTLIILLGVIGATVLLTLGLSLISTKVNVESGIFQALGAVIGSLAMISILYPLIYKFGVEKGRIYIIAGIFIIFAVGFGIVTLVSPWLNSLAIDANTRKLISDFLNNFGIYVFGAIILFLYYISYLISNKFYLKREF